MKKYYTVMMTCAAAVLSSCGTQIQMTEAVPAQVNLGRGTTLIVRSSDRQMVHSFSNKIARDGYYKQPGDGNIKSVATLEVRDINVHRDQNTNAATLSATAEVTTGYQRVYRERYRVGIPRDYEGHYYVEDACDSFAYDVMTDLTPHERTYYVRVNGNSKNPDVEKAALAMKAKNWDLAASYALKAVENDPNDPEAYYACGLIMRYAMKYDVSTKYFEKAYSLKNNGKYMAAISKNRALSINDENVKKQLSGQ